MQGDFRRRFPAGDSCLFHFSNKKKTNHIFKAFKNINFLEFPFCGKLYDFFFSSPKERNFQQLPEILGDFSIEQKV